jgi:protein phosphatase
VTSPRPRRGAGAGTGTGTGTGTFDVRLRDAQPGDRFLLCSDGLSAVVAQDDIREALSPSASPSPEAAVTALLSLVETAGAPDNAGCVVAEVVAL